MKIIFIMGYGRSGSTLLESLISQKLNASAYGEIKYIFERSIGLNEPCSCMRTISSCPVWSKYNSSHLNTDELSKVTKIFESSLMFLRNLLTRDKAFLEKYQDAHGEVLNFLGSQDKSEAIIDSSKMPGRAFWLYRDSVDSSLDIYLIHLIRDPRGVAWSNQKSLQRFNQDFPDSKMPQFGYISSYLRWLLNLIVCEYTKKKFEQRKTLSIRYEDLVLNPEATVRKIAEFVGINYREGDEAIYHSLSGNPARFNGGFKNIKIDDEWKRKLPMHAKLSAKVLLGKKLKEYDYYS